MDGENILPSSPTLIPVHTNLWRENLGSTEVENVITLMLIPVALLGRTNIKVLSSTENKEIHLVDRGEHRDRPRRDRNSPPTMEKLREPHLQAVKDEQDDVLQNEKDPSSLETMSAEMTSLKSRLLFKEEEVQILKDMVAQKDEEIKRLRVRDLKVDALRADVESAWKKFDTYLSITSPERSKTEMKHEKEPGEEEIKGMARKEDEIRFQPIFRPHPPTALLGPPRHSYLSKAESDLVGAQWSIRALARREKPGVLVDGLEKRREN
ncbi:hypothetical protein DKX38_028534 [Salix brachista]|uniref:Uncharacterized protein n=1 Tax=Salix brachista TaxID=2182728 RepID=A0A5N5J5V6_9ROSI|nr:hypothetical protein DKX38_028534 [Salix brachista]